MSIAPVATQCAKLELSPNTLGSKRVTVRSIKHTGRNTKLKTYKGHTVEVYRIYKMTIKGSVTTRLAGFMYVTSYSVNGKNCVDPTGRTCGTKTTAL
jgi:hypothetical protein